MTMDNPIQPLAIEGRWEVVMPSQEPAKLKRGVYELPPAHVVIGWYLAEKKGAWTESTISRTIAALKIFERWLNGRQLSRQTMVDYRDYLAAYRNGGVTQIEWSICRSFIGWLVRNRWVEPNVIESISPPPPKRPPSRPPIRDHHYQKLMDTKGVHPMVRWLVTVMWHTGMALVDAQELRWAEVDLERMVISKVRRKTKAFTRPCIIPVDPSGVLASELIRLNDKSLLDQERIRKFHPEFVRSEYVEPDAARMREHSRWNNAWTEARELAGISPEYSPHCFRRGFVTKLVEGGVNPLIGCAITGHSNPSTFLAYATMDPERVREEMDRALQESAMKAMSRKGQQ